MLAYSHYIQLEPTDFLFENDLSENNKDLTIKQKTIHEENSNVNARKAMFGVEEGVACLRTLRTRLQS